MKFPVCFCLALVFSFSFFADARAQTGFSAINVKQTLNHFDDKPASVSRPRVIGEKADIKSDVAAPPLVFDLGRQVFRLINEKRREQGLKPLEWSDSVAAIAREHSQDMAKNKYFSHNGLDGSNVGERADKSGLKKWRAIGENIAYNRGYKQPIEFAVERWMLSPGHKQNLLNEQWSESAVGIAVTPEGTYYFTQVFLVRK